MSYTEQDLRDVLDRAEEVEQKQSVYVDRSVVDSWKIIPAAAAPKGSDLEYTIHRLNSLGSLYYFSVVVLNKSRFQKNPDHKKNLHYQMCKVVEKDGLKEVIEIPRDHFKSSVYSECYPMWRALPFTQKDELLIRSLGYGDEFIRWMKHAHNQDVRIILISEVIHNAQKLGTKVDGHYTNNEVFKYIFKDILPDSSCQWNNLSFHQKRTPAGKIHGEGTFDFTGVGGAVQSTHYDVLIQDDMMGRAAFESPSILEKTIEYHQLLVGIMDSHSGQAGRDNDEIVVGNRWSYNDLNSYIRANETYFNFTTHSALGGCCALHPYGDPIFPESFSVEKLERFKRRLGNYLFSCQFLNVPINPAEVKFSKGDLRYYEFVRDEQFKYIDTKGKERTKVLIKHHVREGDILPDISPRNLKRYIIVDPNHSGNDGRCRHAITVTGVAENPRRVYLLDVWAKACSIDEFIEVMLHLATVTWQVNEIYLETIAAQKYLKYHLEYRMKESGDEKYANLKIVELKTPKTKNAKQMRIDGLGPIFQRGEFWCNSKGQNEFQEEFETYPAGNLRDVLDTLGYGPSVWDFDSNTEDIELEITKRKNRYIRNTQLNSMGY